jgi:hypothetical protein
MWLSVLFAIDKHELPCILQKITDFAFGIGVPLKEIRPTALQAALGGLVLLLGASQIITIVILLRTRSATQPLVDRSDTLTELAEGGPYFSQTSVRELLGLAGRELAGLADSRIQYTVHVSQTVPIATDVVINEQIPVPVDLEINQVIPVHTEIPLQEQILVPVNLEIDRLVAIDTVIPFQDEIVVPIDEVVQVDEIFETSLLGQTVNIPIRGAIPVQMNVVVPIDKQLPVKTEIPVQFPISETLPIDLDRMVPLNLDIPVNLPVEIEVVVPISRTIPVRVDVPLVLDVPIDIAISDTPLGQYLQRLGEQLP